MPSNLEEARKHRYTNSYSKNAPSDFVEGNCIESIYDRSTGWGITKQCERKAVIDGCWCKIHSPAYIAEKNKKSTEAFEQRMKESKRRFFFERNAKDFYYALEQIANGHNNARELACETLLKTGKEP